MKVTNVTVFPTKTAGKVKANGTVTVEDALDLKFIVLESDKGPYITWQGGKGYEKKDGTKGWDSPIFVKDKALNDSITKTVLAKLSSVGGGTKTAGTSTTRTSYDSSMASDDIPF